MRLDDVPTPALLLDAAIFRENISRMAEHTRRAGKRLRPHAKAHKCVEIAQRQVAAGAVGVCVATVNEAELLARRGIESILLTSPLAEPAKCARVAEISEIAGDVQAVVDDGEQVKFYAEAANRRGVTLTLLVDLDVGDRRTGVAPGEPAAALARLILNEPRLRFGGLQAYSVRASHMSAAEGVANYSAAALRQAEQTRELLRSDGIEVPVVTGGSTGSCAADAELRSIDELQPGSYVLMDGAYARIGISGFGHALTVLATVVSANHPDRVTVDAGYKAFATDRSFGPDVQNMTGLRHQWAGDEFSFVLVEKSAARPRLGDRLRFIPPHCDPTVNLYDRLYVCDGDAVVDVWSIMDRYRAD